MSTEDPRETYEDRVRSFREERARIAERTGTTRRSRLLAFFLLVVGFLGAEWTGGGLQLALLAGGVVATGTFLLLVRRHRRLRAEDRRLRAHLQLNEEALARLERRFDALPASARAPDLDAHPYAEDLDIVGPTSLERLMSTVSTGPGARTLRSWLLEPAGREEADERRMAVDELAPRIDFRQELAARARLAGLGRADPTEAFLAWAREDSWLDSRPLLLWVARGAPLLALLLFLLQLSGWLEGYWWLLGPFVGILFVGTWTERIGEVMDRISAGQRFIGAYGDPLELLEEMEAGSRRLAWVRARSRQGEGRASKALRRLEQWITVADVRYNHLLHVPLQILFFWDVHVLRELERWRERNGAAVDAWLEAVGEAEALAALAALRADHPDWCEPAIIDGARIEGRGVGHPLLAPGRCVVNDVDVGPRDTFLLVTGSNMSGKSTYLRSVGVNAVLALAGGPVCASELRLPEIQVLTSMRTQDSLARGLSSFMAELRRVAFVVERAEKEGRLPLYLLDEPLQGTNEAERREAVRIVLESLLDAGAIGAVATHDLLLHETERLRDAARPVHFGSRVKEVDGDLRLTFDYRLRSGPATSTNALDLLRLVGLGRKDAS